MKKLNILFITEYFPPYVKGGAEVSTSLIVKKISKYCKVYVITSNFQDKSWKFNRVEVFPYMQKNDILEKSLKGVIKYGLNLNKKYILNNNLLGKFVKNKKIDIIHIIPTGIYSLHMLEMVLRLNKPLIIDNRGGSIICPIAFSRPCKKKFNLDYSCIDCVSKNYSINLGIANSLKKAFSFYETLNFKLKKESIIKEIRRRKDLFLVPNSKFVKELLIDAGYPKEKIKVVYNICDFGKFRKRHYRENKIIYAGSLEKSKGIWDVLKGFEMVNDKSLILEIAGDGRELEAIKQYIAKNKISNILVLGRITNEDVLKKYLQSKIIVAPSVAPEAFGRFILESIATRTPLITTPVGGNPEGIKDHETGLLVESNNPKQLAEAIKELLADKTLYNKIVKNLTKEAWKYSPERIGKQRLELYEGLINKSKKIK